MELSEGNKKFLVLTHPDKSSLDVFPSVSEKRNFAIKKFDSVEDLGRDIYETEIVKSINYKIHNEEYSTSLKVESENVNEQKEGIVYGMSVSSQKIDYKKFSMDLKETLNLVSNKNKDMIFDEVLNSLLYKTYNMNVKNECEKGFNQVKTGIAGILNGRDLNDKYINGLLNNGERNINNYFKDKMSKTIVFGAKFQAEDDVKLSILKNAYQSERISVTDAKKAESVIAMTKNERENINALEDKEEEYK